MYVGGYCGLGESELCVFGKLWPVDFLVVCECSSVLLQSIVISYVDLVMMGRWSDDSVVFGTLVGVFVLCVMWSEFLITSCTT